MFLALCSSQAACQEIPSIYTHLKYTGDSLVLSYKEKNFAAKPDAVFPGFSCFLKPAIGTTEGLAFDFGWPSLQGKVYYGLINTRDGSFNYPVFFKRSAAIVGGKCSINLHQLSGKYDMSNWAGNGSGVLGYRVCRSDGHILYDGRVAFGFSGTGFSALPTLIEGPMLSCVSHDSIVIRAVYNQPVDAQLWIDGKGTITNNRSQVHEMVVRGLMPDSKYRYSISPGLADTFWFRTAPIPGSNLPFTLAYASDSRNGKGGGERDIEGVNAYILKRLFALAHQRGASVFQFTGDLIDGYLTDANRMQLQYANWKHVIEPFTRFMPIMATMGNHEALVYRFHPENRWEEGIGIDRFPFENESAEALFASEFAMPVSSLGSEDGCAYDPDKTKVDFPPYRETVFTYQYANTAVIVLNSNYWYAYMGHVYDHTCGNIHGYVMDMQLKWLRGEIERLEKNAQIKHIFLTIHTPFFPNGGHVDDDMWYNGNNKPRPLISGKLVEKGIIERRDEMLDLLINKSSKFKAFLTGDEHNYARTKIGPQTPIYPNNWKGKKVELTRDVWQINNGSAGAPYYGMQTTPWSPFVAHFSTQYALVLLHIDGEEITAEVVNPDTLEEIERFSVE